MRLNAVEARVVGALIEKELTTPQQYPLTLNGLVMACNQSSNREPVVHYDEATVEAALVDLREQRLVRFVHPSHGRSALRYRLVLDEVLGLDERQRALLAVLLLRGPQTLGELRMRTGRLAAFADPGDVERDLASLARLEEPAVARLERRPGQKEDRYGQLLVPEHERAGGADPLEVDARLSGQDVPATSRPLAGSAEPPPPPARHPVASELDALGVQVADLATALAELRQQFEEFRDSLGG